MLVHSYDKSTLLSVSVFPTFLSNLSPLRADTFVRSAFFRSLHVLTELVLSDNVSL